MGCKSSMCTDASELILSQHLGEKLSDVTVSVSEKSTNLSLNSQQKRELEKSPEQVRRLLMLKSIIKISLKGLPNQNELFQLSEIWVQELLKLMDDYSIIPEDLNTTISIDSNGRSLLIKNEFDGIRNFDFILHVLDKCKESVDSQLSSEGFEEKTRFLLGLCPLTLFFYLRLGDEVDIGIGVEKALDRKQLGQVLMNSKDSAGITAWVSKGLQPIAVSLAFSLLGKSRTVNFFIFDGLKAQNFAKGIELFEEFGAHVEDSWIEALRRSNKSDEVYCCIEFNDRNIKRVSMQIQASDLREETLQKIDSHLNFSKWNSFQNLAPGKYIGIELNLDGFVMKNVSQI